MKIVNHCGGRLEKKYNSCEVTAGFKLEKVLASNPFFSFLQSVFMFFVHWCGCFLHINNFTKFKIPNTYK